MIWSLRWFFLQLDLGLGRLQELHRAMGDDIHLAIAVLRRPQEESWRPNRTSEYG